MLTSGGTHTIQEKCFPICFHFIIWRLKGKCFRQIEMGKNIIILQQMLSRDIPEKFIPFYFNSSSPRDFIYNCGPVDFVAV